MLQALSCKIDQNVIALPKELICGSKLLVYMKPTWWQAIKVEDARKEVTLVLT